MRWQPVHQLASGVLHHGQPAETRTWLLDRIDRAKWVSGTVRCRTLAHLSELRVWTWDVWADPSWLEHLRTHLSELTAYLGRERRLLAELWGASSPGAAISTAVVESAVYEIVSRRMGKRQQMRRNRDTAQPLLTVRVHLLNDTLEGALRHWRRAFRPAANAGTISARKAA